MVFIKSADRARKEKLCILITIRPTSIFTKTRSDVAKIIQIWVGYVLLYNNEGRVIDCHADRLTVKDEGCFFG